MEKSQAEKKSSSFSFFRSKEEADPLPDTSLEVVLQEVDLFVVVLSSTEDKSALPKIPAAAESLPAKVESMISKPDGEDDLLDAVRRLASVHDLIAEFSFEKCAFHGRSASVLAKAMSFLEKRFRGLLEEHKGSKTLKSKSFDKEGNELNRSDSAGSGSFPGYSEETVAKMGRIATVMVSAGKEAECGQIYHSVRRKALKSELNRLGLGFDKINGDNDVAKMAWEALENQISSCIQILKACAAAIFPAERRLCESVFSDYPEIYHREYTSLGMTGLTRLLGFAGAVPKAKRSTDKLFKFLDLYECFRDVTLEIEDSYLECGDTDLTVEISSVKERLAGSAIAIFGELEKTIRSDAVGKAPAPNGDVHNTTRYTMNYLRNACEYRSTLEQIFLQGQSIAPPPAEEAEAAAPTPNDDGTPKNSPFAAQLMKTIDLLDETLESRSALYKDASLRLVFLMNNGRYILQKIKESPDIHELVGDNFYRKRSSAVRMHHKNYTRETWGRLLQTLNPQGLLVTNGKLNSKPMLKERFKSFNHTFEEIHKTQSAWVVGEEQLQSEMRASVSAMVIPAYRSFLARFLPFLTPGRQVEKYVKYQPDDVETLIEGLFSGNPSTIGKKNKN